MEYFADCNMAKIDSFLVEELTFGKRLASTFEVIGKIEQIEDIIFKAISFIVRQGGSILSMAKIIANDYKF